MWMLFHIGWLKKSEAVDGSFTVSLHALVRSLQNGVFFFIEADIVTRNFLFRNQMSCKLLIFEECKSDFQSALKFESHIFYP